MQQGYGIERLLVMHNDFLIVGPAADPAHIRGDASALDAMQRIAEAQSWYVESGTGMGQTVTIADQKEAYTISDRATLLAFTGKIQLAILVQRDPALLNVYHVMPVNPDKFPNVIGEFGVDKFGQQLFVPDAGKSEAEVGL